MYGKFIRYYYHKSFIVDEENLFVKKPSTKDVIACIKNNLEKVVFLSTEEDIIFVYKGIRYKAECEKFRGKYAVSAKEF